MKCELCGKEPEGENLIMDFNCLLPSFNVMCKGWICLDCFGKFAHDLEIVSELIKSRAKAKNIELPVKGREVFVSLLNPET